jgi:hypothetical protein
MIQGLLKLVYINTIYFFQLIPVVNSSPSQCQSFVSYNYSLFSKINFRLLIAAIKVVYYNILKLKDGIICEIVRF